jgi:hypothetical protein
MYKALKDRDAAKRIDNNCIGMKYSPARIYVVEYTISFILLAIQLAFKYMHARLNQREDWRIN